MNFEYMFIEQAQDSLDIEDLGHVCLNAFNDEGEEFFLYIDTEYGWSKIIILGPLNADMEELPYYLNINYTKMEYNEKRLYQTINNFLNNDKRMITQAFQVDTEKFYERLKNIVNKM